MLKIEDDVMMMMNSEKNDKSFKFLGIQKTVGFPFFIQGEIQKLIYLRNKAASAIDRGSS